jgi:hypothetical protein
MPSVCRGHEWGHSVLVKKVDFDAIVQQCAKATDMSIAREPEQFTFLVV